MTGPPATAEELPTCDSDELVGPIGQLGYRKLSSTLLDSGQHSGFVDSLMYSDEAIVLFVKGVAQKVFSNLTNVGERQILPIAPVAVGSCFFPTQFLRRARRLS